MIFKCTNTAYNTILVVAPNETEAKKFCLKIRHTQQLNNVKLSDITDSYTNTHSKYGFTEPTAIGKLIMLIKGDTERQWNVWTGK